MEGKKILSAEIRMYTRFLTEEEKSAATRTKYLRDIHRLSVFLSGEPITKERIAAWKTALQKEGYAPRSINSMLASVNSFLSYIGCPECCVKNLRIQKNVFCPAEKELTKAEYLRLLKVSTGDEQLRLILQTICGTGIRVSELRYFTVEALRSGGITVHCKNKTRTVLIPGKLKKALLQYAKRHKIRSGPIFLGRHGAPLSRSLIWRKMKQLCRAAGVSESKVFPHNLRKLFARTFYKIEKDIAKLADVLGHSSINTTRIYIMTSGLEHRQKIERLGLVI